MYILYINTTRSNDVYTKCGIQTRRFLIIAKKDLRFDVF